MIFILILTLFISPAFATLGIGVSPVSSEINFNDGKNLWSRNLNVILTNNGNVPIIVHIRSEDVNVNFSENDFVLPACSCDGYCKKEVVQCSILLPVKQLIMTVYNPNYVEKTAKIIFEGSQQSSSGAMVKTGINAVITLRLFNSLVTTTTIIPTTTTIHQNQQTTSTTTIITTTTTVKQNSGGSTSGTVKKTTTTTTLNPINSKIIVNNKPYDEILTNPNSTLEVPQEENNQGKKSIAYMLFNTNMGFYIIITSIVLVIFVIIMVIQRKKNLSSDNPLLQENQGTIF